MEVHRWRGRATDFHGLPFPEPLSSAQAWVFDVERPALVLGSAQRGHVADTATAAERGVEVVRRRSGGGAVLLVPGECLWIDVLLPRADPRWVTDVGRSADWLGEVWARVLAQFGVDGAVHHGVLHRTEWSRLVCFGAIGPGEVSVDGRKVVGISQRRTRVGARLQCLVLARWDPAALLRLLVMEPRDRARARADLVDAASGLRIPPAELEAAFLAELRLFSG